MVTRIQKSDSCEQRFEAVNEAFAEVIERNRPFGSLLTKIKEAYGDYMEEVLEQNGVTKKDQKVEERIKDEILKSQQLDMNQQLVVQQKNYEEIISGLKTRDQSKAETISKLQTKIDELQK